MRMVYLQNNLLKAKTVFSAAIMLLVCAGMPAYANDRVSEAENLVTNPDN